MKYEDGLNDMAGGKAIDHKQPKKIRSDTPFEKSQRELVDDYKGKWCVRVFFNFNQANFLQEKFDTQHAAEDMVKELYQAKKEGGHTFDGIGGGTTDVKKMTFAIAMPWKGKS